LDEQRKSGGMGFSSLKQWFIHLQKAVLSNEAILEHSRKFHLQQQGTRSISQWHQEVINGRKFHNQMAKVPKIDRKAILVMFIGAMSKQDRLRDKVVEKYKGLHGHAFHECPPELARQRLVEMVQCAQEIEIKIHTKRSLSQHRSFRSTSPGRHHPGETSRFATVEDEVAWLKWAAADPSKATNKPIPAPRARTPQPGIRTPVQQPVGLLGTDRQANQGLRPTQAGPASLNPKACWSCGSTEHLKFDCKATPAQVEAYKSTRLPFLRTNQARFSEVRDDEDDLLAELQYLEDE
jgi:hypothetical protein